MFKAGSAIIPSKKHTTLTNGTSLDGQEAHGSKIEVLGSSAQGYCPFLGVTDSNSDVSKGQHQSCL